MATTVASADPHWNWESSVQGAVWSENKTDKNTHAHLLSQDKVSFSMHFEGN